MWQAIELMTGVSTCLADPPSASFETAAAETTGCNKLPAGTALMGAPVGNPA
jgi:hypothetical protein